MLRTQEVPTEYAQCAKPQHFLSKLYKSPTSGASFHMVTQLATENIQLHGADNSQVDRILLFILNYLIIKLLFNFPKCLNIVRTSSKTLYCTLQGHNLTYFTEYFQNYRLQIVRDSLSRLFIIECPFLQSLLLNKHYFKTNKTA